MHTVNFSDAQLQKCYDDNFVEMDNLAEDLRQIRALIITHDLFQMLEGPHSARVHEILEHLVSTELRPALRGWYQRSNTGMDPVVVEFRDELNKLTGEQLEILGGLSQTPQPKTVRPHKEEPICDDPRELKPKSQWRNVSK